MIKVLKKGLSIAFAFVSLVFTFSPESFFAVPEWSLVSQIIGELTSWRFRIDDINIVCNRVSLFIILWGLATLFIYIYIRYIRKAVVIKDDDFIITVKYGNIFNEKDCKRVIGFDECFTTTIGNAPHEIKPTSICGQYLQANPNINMQQLIADAHLTKERGKSKFNRQDKYKSGSIVPNGDDFLLAFAPLDENGRGVFSSYKEYLDSLFLLWQELDKYYAQCDVCIPILGSGITRIGDGMGTTIPQQKLLKMIIDSYKLSPYKLKRPYKLRIVCRKNDDFSLECIR